jgi:hypothetical protein
VLLYHSRQNFMALMAAAAVFLLPWCDVLRSSPVDYGVGRLRARALYTDGTERGSVSGYPFRCVRVSILF